MTTFTTANTLSISQEQRFNELMESTYRKVYNMAYRLSGSRPDAEDLTQEAFFRAYRSFGDYEGDRPFENWILRIVTRLHLDLLRNRKRRVQTVSYDATLTTDSGSENVRFEVADKGPSPEDELVESSYSEAMQRALETLKPAQRELIELADVQQVSYDEIAAKLGAPVGTIRSRLHRAHKQLKSELSKSHAGNALKGNRS